MARSSAATDAADTNTKQVSASQKRLVPLTFSSSANRLKINGTGVHFFLCWFYFFHHKRYRNSMQGGWKSFKMVFNLRGISRMTGIFYSLGPCQWKTKPSARPQCTVSCSGLKLRLIIYLFVHA